MESIGDFVPAQATRPGAGILTGMPRLTPVPHEMDEVGCALDRALALLRSATRTAMTDTALYGVKEASDFADRAEQLSRMADYLQLVAAGAVDRTRSRAAAQPAGSVAGPGAPAGWLAGWNTDEAIPPAPADGPAAAPECLDDGYRSPAEFLRARLGISVSEARRRLSLAANVLPRTGIAGQLLPEVREELAAAVAAGTVARGPRLSSRWHWTRSAAYVRRKRRPVWNTT